MELTFAGTGSVVPTGRRAGPSLAVSVGERTLLFDCGPDAVHRLVACGVHPASVEHLFLTRHSVERNADFVHFWMASWSVGREALAVYGPPGTDDLVEALSVWSEDAEYRLSLGRSPAGLTDVERVQVTEDTRVEGDGWTVEAGPLYGPAGGAVAYRVEADGGDVVVALDHDPAIASFAAGADVLVAGCPAGPAGDWPEAGLAWQRFIARAGPDPLEDGRPSATDLAAVADDAGVPTLVITNVPPYRDVAAVGRAVGRAYEGSVVVAEDGASREVGS